MFLLMKSTNVYMVAKNMPDNPISFRLNVEQSDRLNQLRGEKSASTYCKDIVIQFLSTNVDEKSTNVNNTDILKQIESLQHELQHKNDIIKIKDETIKRQDSYVGYLQLEFSKLNSKFLLPEKSEEEEVKPWWQFWK